MYLLRLDDASDFMDIYSVDELKMKIVFACGASFL